MMACISEPISWLRLERYALSAADTSVSEHLAACDACRHCLDEIKRDVVALPPLHVVAKRRWWRLALPAIGALAVAAAILFVLRPRPALREGVATIKGIGEVVVDVVRERAGTIRDDVRTFKAGDRWKVVITCPPTKTVVLDVAIREHGSERDDHPLAQAQLVCGNRIALPGAFELAGDKPHRVCVRIEAQADDQPDACLTLSPE